MTETITVNAVDRSGVIQRKNVELVESAYLGEVGAGRFQVDDAAGTIDIPGWKAITVEQSSSTPARIFTGYTGRKGIRRGETYQTGAGREIDVSTYDLNDLLRRHVIRKRTGESAAAGGKRPAETVGERVTWLVASGFLDADDFGAVTYPSGTGMDKTDYRGQYPGDVLAACAKAVRFNYYIRWNTANAAAELVFRDDNASTADTCTLSISNDMADIDSTTVFAPAMEAELSVDPEDVYSGAYAAYDKGAVYEDRAATATAFADRDGITEDSGIKTAAKARLEAQTFLHESHTEEQILPVVLRLRASKVGLVQAGQRISTRMTHMANEGWDPAQYARILRKRITQPLNTDNDYDVHLDLSPQEDAPAAAQIVQTSFGFWGTGGSGLTPYHHLANPPSIGNTLIVMISMRSGSAGQHAYPIAPNTSSGLPRWGAGAWTELPLSVGGFTSTYVEEVAGNDAHDGISIFYKTVDSTSQDGTILNDYENVGIYEVSGLNMGTAVLARKNNQTATATFDVGTLGTVAVGELAFMISHSEPGYTGVISPPALAMAAGWYQTWYQGNYPFWSGPTRPVVWMGHAYGDGTAIDPVLTSSTARRWAGLAFKVGP